MKLKKIASLMLAGVMAVSMLAGCSTTSEEPQTPVDPQEPAATSSIATALNAQLSTNQANALSFSANSDLANAMSWMTGDHVDRLLITDTLIQNAGRPTLLNVGGVVNRIGAGLDGMVPAVQAMGNRPITRFSTADNNMYLYVWTIDGSVSSVNTIAAEIMNGNGGGLGGNGLQDLVYDQLDLLTEDVIINTRPNGGIAIPGTTSENITHEYKGYAEMVQVTNSLSTDTAYVVAVLIQQYSTTNT